MDTATTFLLAIVIGVAFGAASSLVTRKMGVWPGVAFAAVFVVAALALLTVVEFGAVIAAMLAFSVTASILDPRSPMKLATS